MPIFFQNMLLNNTKHGFFIGNLKMYFFKVLSLFFSQVLKIKRNSYK